MTLSAAGISTQMLLLNHVILFAGKKRLPHLGILNFESDEPNADGPDMKTVLPAMVTTFLIV